MFFRKIVASVFIFLLGGQQVAAGSADLAQRLRLRRSELPSDACGAGARDELDAAQAEIFREVAALARGCQAAKAKAARKCAAGSDDPVDPAKLFARVQSFAQQRERAMRCDWAADWLAGQSGGGGALLDDLRGLYDGLDAKTRALVPLDLTALDALDAKEPVETVEKLQALQTEVLERFAPGLGGAEAQAAGEKQAELGGSAAPSKLASFDLCFRATNTTWERFHSYFTGPGTGCGASQGCFAVTGPVYDDEDEKPSVDLLLAGELLEAEGGGLAKSAELSWGVCLPKDVADARQYFRDVQAELRLVKDLAAELEPEEEEPAPSSFAEAAEEPSPGLASRAASWVGETLFGSGSEGATASVAPPVGQTGLCIQTNLGCVPVGSDAAGAIGAGGSGAGNMTRVNLVDHFAPGLVPAGVDFLSPYVAQLFGPVEDQLLAEVLYIAIPVVFELLVVYSVYLVFSVAQFALAKLARLTLTAVKYIAWGVFATLEAFLWVLWCTFSTMATGLTYATVGVLFTLISLLGADVSWFMDSLRARGAGVKSCWSRTFDRFGGSSSLVEVTPERRVVRSA